jgi:hypothetical protein
VVLTVVLVGAGYVGFRALTGKLPHHLPITLLTQECVVNGEVDGEPHTVDLSTEQMANAATIAAVGISRKVPPRGIVVALAAAQQESKLINVSGGDRDSVGLFQQRPSQGWGTPQQIADPRYAAGRFYTALLKVKGWQNLRVADAAQKVQRSFNGELYQRWAPSAQVMTDAFVGTTGGALACTITQEPSTRGTNATAALAQSLTLDWGKVVTSSDARVAGLAVDVAAEATGWQYAHWLVAHAADSSIKSVTFGNRVWTAKSGSWSTQSVDPATAAGTTRVVAEVYPG